MGGRKIFEKPAPLSSPEATCKVKREVMSAVMFLRRFVIAGGDLQSQEGSHVGKKT
jgi:hypothetical protein